MRRAAEAAGLTKTLWLQQAIYRALPVETQAFVGPPTPDGAPTGPRENPQPLDVLLVALERMGATFQATGNDRALYEVKLQAPLRTHWACNGLPVIWMLQDHRWTADRFWTYLLGRVRMGVVPENH